MPLVQPDPLHEHGYLLAGGPAPERTSDWMRALVAVLTFVAVRDALPASTLFAAEPGREPDIVVRLAPVAPILEAVAAPALVVPLAAGLIVLHPPGIDPAPDLEEPAGHPVASGSLLLPGMPEVGLDHRAAWAAVDTTGQVAHMRFTTHATLHETVDLAVLGALLG